jgi:hypothetical protein
MKSNLKVNQSSLKCKSVHKSNGQVVAVRNDSTWLNKTFFLKFYTNITHNRPRTYYLQRSATEHSSTCHYISFLHNLLNVLVLIANFF